MTPTQTQEAMNALSEQKQRDYMEIYHMSLHELENAFNTLSATEAERRVYEAHENLFKKMDDFLRDYSDGVDVRVRQR